MVVVDKWDTVPLHSEDISPQSFVDVWWLVDDGGLTIMLPWLIQRNWPCPMRIFAIPASISTVARETRLVEKMIREFRIDGDVVVVTPDEVEVSNDEVHEFCAKNHISSDYEARSHRYLVLSKLFSLYSRDSVAVFCSLPFPRPDIDSNVWMAWLQLLNDSVDKAMVFVRG